MRIDTLHEHDVTDDMHARIRCLRNRSFPSYAVDRSYGKQLPHLRLVALNDEELIGVVGVDHRVVAIRDVPRRIFGLVDLCVDERYRSRGVGTHLLRSVEALARRSGIDALLLIADDARIYSRNGFVRVPGMCRWLRIDEHESLGIAREDLGDELMGKNLRDDGRMTGPIDFLGYLF